MSEFRFYHPVEVRYADLDPQGHVNNAKYLTYMEQARAHYLLRLGLWDGRSFLDLGIILAEARVSFLAPIIFGQDLRVGARVTRLGNKSIIMEYCLEEDGSSTTFATGSTVLVAYDYQSSQTVPVPQDWRQVISEFEGLSQPT